MVPQNWVFPSPAWVFARLRTARPGAPAKRRLYTIVPAAIKGKMAAPATLT